MSKKVIAAIFIGMVIFGAAYQSSRNVTLTVGIFAGNNWDVPQGEPYAIIDAENPNVKVKRLT